MFQVQNNNSVQAKNRVLPQHYFLLSYVTCHASIRTLMYKISSTCWTSNGTLFVRPNRLNIQQVYVGCQQSNGEKVIINSEHGSSVTIKYDAK